MIPNVSTLGTCTVADKGKVVFYGPDNSLRVCNGTSWLNISNSSELNLPFSATQSNADNTLFSVSNSNVANDKSAIKGITNSAFGGSGIYGVSDNFYPTGTTYGVSAVNRSLNSNGYGLFGYHTGSGIATYGETPSGVGVYGKSIGGIGIKGFSLTGIGGYFISSSMAYSLLAIGGKVGLGTETPTKAYMVVDGKIGATHAIFGENTSGVAIESDYPGISFNGYWNSGRKPLINGYLGGLGFNPINGQMVLYNTNSSNTAGNNVITQDLITMNNAGFVGVGISPANKLDVNGRMRIRHTVVSDTQYTSGVWMSNSSNSLSIADGAFYGNKSDTETGIFIGNNWRFWVKNNGNVVNSGFTQLGNDIPSGSESGASAPAIKTLKLVGTTSNSDGGNVILNTGISKSKILDISILINTQNVPFNLPISIPNGYTLENGFECQYICINSQLKVYNVPSNSYNILSKAFTVLITYEE
ncbi:hypothetical protein [Lacihabitans lacunae]|uniref:Uncharacterized protein n=1 Tax=Lacihabitans lacunae TaxID=1028214 RepID=A0ABV7YVB9_9BACT